MPDFAPGPGTRVLVVEDDPTNQFVAREMLRLVGFEAEVASSGVQALAMLAAEGAAFDAVLLDVHLADMDGYEVTRWIRAHERCRAIPVIALTASGHARDRQACLDAGMDDHLPKPLDPEALGATLSRWIGHRPAPAPLSSPAGLPRSLPGVDLEAALKRCKGDAEWLGGLLAEFASTSVERMDLLRSASSQEDRRTGVRLAHSLRGVALTLSMPEISAAAERLEQALEGADPSGMARALEDLERAMATFQAGWPEGG